MTGAGSASFQSAVLIPVPEADAVVGRWRLAHDPVGTAGVPAHITLVVPWLHPDSIRQADLDALDAELADVKAFDFDLARVEWFGRRVLWAAPEPGQPFLDLTNRLAARFGTPPWQNEFDEVVPHLTVAHASDEVQLDRVARELAARLPLHCRAEEVWVMAGSGGSWELRHRAPLVA
jgi:2'-5' RNA ligase